MPIYYSPDRDTAWRIADACLRGGAPCIEMTNRGDGAMDVFKHLEAQVRNAYPKAILGIGSVVEAPTAAHYIALGANFVVSPCLDAATALLCNKRKIPYMPGCATVTEIHRAEALGVEICKIFPGDAVGGPGFAKAVLAPCPWTSLMATGGVAPTRESLSEWFDAGIVCVGMGSKLIARDLVRDERFDDIAANVRNALDLIQEIR